MISCCHGSRDIPQERGLWLALPLSAVLPRCPHRGLTGLWVAPFVSTHIPAPAAPAEGSQAVHSDEDSCLQQRNKSTEGNIGTCPGIFQTASEGSGILTASGSWHSLHYDQNIKEQTRIQRGEKSILLTDLCINNNNNIYYYNTIIY